MSKQRQERFVIRSRLVSASQHSTPHKTSKEMSPRFKVLLQEAGHCPAQLGWMYYSKGYGYTSNGFASGLLRISSGTGAVN